MANVPIVTEVTYAQLLVLIAANGLNEGLQYKVTDKNWLIIATSVNSYIFCNSVPYKSYVAFLTDDGEGAISADIVMNEIGNIVWAIDESNQITGTLTGAFTVGKTIVRISSPFAGNYDSVATRVGVDLNFIAFSVIDTTSGLIVANEIFDTPIEIRVYEN